MLDFRSIYIRQNFKNKITATLIDRMERNERIKVALPHHTDYIVKYGPSAFHYFLDELELNLLAELGNMLSGQIADKDHLEKAAQILQESERLMQENESMKSKQ